MKKRKRKKRALTPAVMRKIKSREKCNQWIIGIEHSRALSKYHQTLPGKSNIRRFFFFAFKVKRSKIHSFATVAVPRAPNAFLFVTWYFYPPRSQEVCLVKL